MAREQQSDVDPEASLLDRRNYLRATGILAGTVGLGAVSRSATAADGISAEVRSVETNHEWTTVELSDSHADPVVIAPSVSYRGPQPATPRLRNVTGSSAGASFELSVEEWRYLDGAHRYEAIGYVAADPGSYSLGDGTRLEIGRVGTNHRWTSNSFSASFSATPVVFSQTQTVNGPQPIVTRHRGVSESEFDVRLQEEESLGPHRTEDVGYLAIEPGSGTLNGRAFEAGTRADVTDTWQTIQFGDTYRQPVFVADGQSFRGANTCGVRYRNLTDSSVEVKIEEERSHDDETAHLGERVGYLVVEGVESDTPLSDLDGSRVEKRVHDYVNEHRAEHGLASLDFDTDLREIARYHSEDMAANDYFAHTSPSGETTSDRYEKFGYDCRADAGDGTYYTGAENIAYTYYDQRVRTGDGETVRYTNADELAQGIVRGWMNSEGHRENILMEAWDREGIGVFVTDEGKVYATQNFC
jgi:uncharacterized protein YkwD